MAMGERATLNTSDQSLPAKDPHVAGQGAVSTGELADQLVEWFLGAARDLPWRRDRTAYRVWLSEVMLQQTQVARVVDYFERFVARFPTVAALAAASEDEVLSLWSGLGYYSRGRNLHRAAQAVMADLGGVFPSTAKGLQALPGVGAYTSAAVASFAYGEPVAVVDGNVLRVLSRLTDEPEAVNLPATHARLGAVAQHLVDAVSEVPFTANDTESAPTWLKGRPSSSLLNEGLMELGALVCSPAPKCLVCPWRDVCAARRHGTEGDRPVKIRARPRKYVRLAAVVVDVDGELWLERRASKGLFGGMWQPPMLEIADGDDVEVAWTAMILERGLTPPLTMPPALVVEKTLTHRELRFEILRFSTSTTPTAPMGVPAQCLGADALGRVGIPNAIAAVLKAEPQD